MQIRIEVQTPARQRALVDRRRVGEPSARARVQAQGASRHAGSARPHGGIVREGVPSVSAAVINEAAGHEGRFGSHPVSLSGGFQLEDRRCLSGRRRPVAD